MKFLALAFCFLFGASGTVAFAGPAEEANAVIDQWSATYSANDRDALVGAEQAIEQRELGLYAPDAVLLGTTSPAISEGKREYGNIFRNCREAVARTRLSRYERSSSARHPSWESDFTILLELQRTIHPGHHALLSCL